MSDKKVMTYDEYIAFLRTEMLETEHEWRTHEEAPDKIDTFAYSIGIHNGPVCVKCGYSYCQNCDTPKKECPAA